MDKSTNLVWIDLEMTGLNPDRDKVLEIAVLITDKDLNIIAEGPTLIIGQQQLPEMDDWVTQAHTASGLLDKVASSKVTLQEAEAKVLEFIMRHTEEKTSPLCGNSIWQDKQFLQKYMPQLMAHLHYRIIDVSTIKELVKLWYPVNRHAEFEKAKVHRALDDIKESIDELKHYKKYFFVEV